ncbi:hypothetical protein PRIPAC_94382, partial [Pristionchus pacificus]
EASGCDSLGHSTHGNSPSWQLLRRHSTMVEDTEDRPSTPFFLGIADMHAISLGPVPVDKLHNDVFHMAASLIAAGIDPSTTVLFRMSTIPEISQLSWILGSLQTVSKLNRLPQYKDKSGRFARSGVPLGLLSYPVLQAADVLAFRATHVPVGADQSQHMNLLTDLALSANTAWMDDMFPIPKALISPHARIKSLRAPQQKMSKSDSSEKRSHQPYGRLRCDRRQVQEGAV